MPPIDICIYSTHAIQWFCNNFFCQETGLPFSLKKEEIELAQDSVSLGADVNYMGIIPTGVERFMIDMVSWENTSIIHSTLYILICKQ